MKIKDMKEWGKEGKDREKERKQKRRGFWREWCVWEGEEANKKESVCTEDKDEEENDLRLRVLRSSKA